MPPASTPREGSTAWKLAEFKRFRKLSLQEGGLTQPFVASLLLGVSRQRVHQLIEEGRVLMIGPVRQEILSGIRIRKQFEELRDRLRGFPDLPLTEEDHELAAEYFTALRAKGIQGSNTDFLICAVAVRGGHGVLTTDKDFTRYRAVVPLKLHQPRWKP